MAAAWAANHETVTIRLGGRGGGGLVYNVTYSSQSEGVGVPVYTTSGRWMGVV